MFKQPGEWYAGAQIYDMHDGWTQILKECAVHSLVVWDLYQDTAPAFIKLLNDIRASSGESQYTNKLMLLINDEDASGFYVAAWCYDGMKAGICYIKPRNLQEDI